MEGEGERNASRKCTQQTRRRREKETRTLHDHRLYQYHLLQSSYRLEYSFGFFYHNFPWLQLHLPPPAFPMRLNPTFYSDTHLRAVMPEQKNLPPATSPETHVFALSSVRVSNQGKSNEGGRGKAVDFRDEPVRVARRPDSGGVEGEVIPLLANHFLVDFDFSKRIFHYDVELSPLPSKEVARMIKKKLVDQHSSMLSGAHPAYDGRRTIYSPIEFQEDKLELYISLPLSSHSPAVFPCQEKDKIFKLRIKLVSKFDGEALRRYLLGEEDEDGDSVPFPQEYIHALDVVLRERSREKFIESGQSFYSPTMEDAEGIGGGAVALRGFFQSLRPTSQGLSLNVDFSMTAFYESIGVLLYLQKRFDFMIDLSQERSSRSMTSEERKQVEKALLNMRVFVLHRETVQRYLVHGLTKESAGDLCFSDRDGKSWNLVKYFEERYGYGVVHVNLPCLQISRRKPCFVPMELCLVCEGQKFIGKLTDEQTAKMLKISCQRPHERKKIINGVMENHLVSDGEQVKEFDLRVAREMTELKGRILQPPAKAAAKLGNGIAVEGLRIERWGVISFGGSPEERSRIPNFIAQLSKRCEQLGIFLNKNTAVDPLFEPMHVLGNPGMLETKLCKIRNKAFDDLQLLICIMERKHKGYADLKCIAETRIGVISQCCLYLNLGNKMSSQFLANMALKINAKLGGSTLSRHGYLHCEIPRLFRREKPIIFMGADVTHPHPLDDCSPSVAAVVGTVNWPAANKYVSKMRSQKHREEIIQELSSMVVEILEDFYEELSDLPSRIVFFRDGVSETQFRKVLEHELRSIRRGCRSRFPGYDPPITFMVVQKRHHTRLFPRESDQNVPPGTVVDSVITHPREFDFYLCSHFGVKGTSRPIHYHVLWDENGFTSDEIQKLVYNLCYTFVRCTVPVSLVPPAYYAHLAAYRGRLYLHRSVANSGITRVSPPETVPLPRISDNIRKLMFYC